MRRTLQTVAVPVFQFGLFSENDLSFFAGPNFNFGGRVHSNANVYLASGNGTTLTLAIESPPLVKSFAPTCRMAGTPIRITQAPSR